MTRIINKVISIIVWGYMILGCLYVRNISLLLSSFECYRDMWFKLWEIFSDKFNCIWYKVIVLFMCYFFGFLLSFYMM